MITELIRFEAEVFICNGNELEFKGESVSVMRDFCWYCHRSVSVMDIDSSGSTILYL